MMMMITMKNKGPPGCNVNSPDLASDRGPLHLLQVIPRWGRGEGRLGVVKGISTKGILIHHRGEMSHSKRTYSGTTTTGQ